MNSPEDTKEGCIATTDDAITSANVNDDKQNNDCDPNEIITVIELDETLQHKDKVDAQGISDKGKLIF